MTLNSCRADVTGRFQLGFIDVNLDLFICQIGNKRIYGTFAFLIVSIRGLPPVAQQSNDYLDSGDRTHDAMLITVRVDVSCWCAIVSHR